MSFSNCVQRRETDFFGTMNIFFNGLHELKKNEKLGFPGGSVVKNPPASARDNEFDL